jgi:hypothetical protein
MKQLLDIDSTIITEILIIRYYNRMRIEYSNQISNLMSREVSVPVLGATHSSACQRSLLVVARVRAGTVVKSELSYAQTSNNLKCTINICY